MQEVKFVAYCKAEPQGSMRGFVMPGKNGAKARAILTSTTKNLKPYRQQLTLAAMEALKAAGMTEPLAEKHVGVKLVVDFFFQKPASVSKKRLYPAVKPDLSKLIRSTEDAMIGILYVDDAQIVEVKARKHYGTPERVEVKALVDATFTGLQEIPDAEEETESLLF